MTAPRPAEDAVDVLTRGCQAAEDRARRRATAPLMRVDARRVRSLLSRLAAVERERDELRRRLFPGQGESYANEVERQRVVIDTYRDALSRAQGVVAEERARAEAAEARLAAVEAALMQGGQSAAIRAQQALFALAAPSPQAELTDGQSFDVSWVDVPASPQAEPAPTAAAPVPPQPEYPGHVPISVHPEHVVRLRAAIDYPHGRDRLTDCEVIEVAADQLERPEPVSPQPEPTSLQQALGLSDEQMAEASDKLAEDFARIRESERQASIKTQGLIIGSAQPEPERCEHGRTEAHKRGVRGLGFDYLVQCPGPVSPQSTEETSR